MPIVLYRVDERLIHGQVVVGWGGRLRPQRYIVVDEALGDSDWERELYALGVPEGQEAFFFAPEEARGRLKEWKEDPVRTILLTRDIPTMALLARGGLLEGEEVNLGGIHFGAGRQKVLPYLFFSQEDRVALEEIAREGAVVSARDLPASTRVPLNELLG